MKAKLYLPLLLTSVVLFGGCQQSEPEPDYSGIQRLTYTLHATSASAAQTQVWLYPNPFGQYVTVQVAAQQGQTATIYLSDPKGRYNKKIELPDGNATQVQVDFGRMPKGVYSCEVRLPGSVRRYRLLKGN
ncbi:T9SS type A sorting domain-containing protein [Pontibacter chitinilyticus]|uniref:T9SS type A sorting domain-containing protein n=1 Tax=Pontibacter chitinilyticus TaxID=2674989 RepID=UPI00321C154A